MYLIGPHTGKSKSKNQIIKIEKYKDLPSAYNFIPIAIESFGPMNEAASEFLTALEGRISVISEDKREASFLRQRISMALQRFNAVCFRGSFSVPENTAYEGATNPDLYVSPI